MAMKLIICIVQDVDADRFSNALRVDGLSSTKLSSTGGFLREGNTTFLIGVAEDQVPTVLGIIERNCHARTRFVFPVPSSEFGDLAATQPIEVQVGGAVVFVLDVANLLRL